MFELYGGDCLTTLELMDDNSVDAIVTDPPYGLSFMGKRWDYDVPSEAIWRECLRVLKPGGHLLAFAGTRTQHRMAVRIEDAGFEIRDMIAWVYGSGFPKSLDVSKAIDKSAGRIGQSVIDLKQRLIALADASGMTRSAIDAACGFRATNYMTFPADGKKPDPWVNCLPPREKWAIMKHVLGADDSMDEVFTHAEREVVGVRQVVPGVAFSSDGPTELEVTAPATDAARQWQGWGTALKPALEPITVARKPLVGTVAENVLAHGTGAINVDGCRVAASAEDIARAAVPQPSFNSPTGAIYNMKTGEGRNGERFDMSAGRWPANLIHDGSEEVAEVFGDPARFFYCAKASKRDRDAGLDGMREVRASEITGRAEGSAGLVMSGGKANPYAGTSGEPRKNHHPTVKPTDLMRYLCRLVTPPGGVVLDPFMGSGSTGKAAMLEGFRFIGCELSPEYLAIARARIAASLSINDIA